MVDSIYGLNLRWQAQQGRARLQRLLAQVPAKEELAVKVAILCGYASVEDIEEALPNFWRERGEQCRMHS
jgi:hypothetical protein